LLVRNQPALRTGSRRRWLLPAGAVAAVAIGMLVTCYGLQRTFATVGIGLVVALFLAMAACSVAIESIPRRNLVLAWLLGAMAFAAVGALFAVLLSVAGR